MSAAAPDRRSGRSQHGLPGLEHNRLWSRQPPRTADPLDSPDRCPDCDGTGTDLATPGSTVPCRSCDGSGWAP
jgi:hypothetical protein